MLLQASGFFSSEHKWLHGASAWNKACTSMCSQGASSLLSISSSKLLCVAFENQALIKLTFIVSKGYSSVKLTLKKNWLNGSQKIQWPYCTVRCHYLDFTKEPEDLHTVAFALLMKAVNTMKKVNNFLVLLWRYYNISDTPKDS